MNIVVSLSGGTGSYVAALRAKETLLTPDDNLLLVFMDTLIEDDDLYRFLHQSVDDLGGEFVYLCDGRTPWQVFRDERFVGNSLVDPCSKLLKRKLFRRWLTTRCHPSNTIIILGIDWTESHRLDAAERRWALNGWTVYAPLCERPYLDKFQMADICRSRGIEPPELYKYGFAHNNCGGFCVKAGQGQFKLLLQTHRDRYLSHERQEEALRAELGDVSILREKYQGVKRRLPLRVLRERIEANEPIDDLDLGGCNCFDPESLFDE